MGPFTTLQRALQRAAYLAASSESCLQSNLCVWGQQWSGWSKQAAGYCTYGDQTSSSNWRERREKRERGPVWMSRGSTAGKRGKYGKAEKRGGSRDSEERMMAVDRLRLERDTTRDEFKQPKSKSRSRRESEDEEKEVTSNDDLFELSGLDVQGSGKAPRPFTAPQNPLNQPFSRPNIGAFNAVKPQHLKTLDAHFAEWFIGITEAQCPDCFEIKEDGRCRFSLHHTNIQMHYKIRDNLKFGQVDVERGEWYVEKPEGIVRIFSLLNGNLFVESSCEKFHEWFEAFKAVTSDSEGILEDVKDLKVDMTCDWRPQLNNKWLMGLIDSGIGMFAGRLPESSQPPFFDVDLKFWVLHKDKTMLEHLKRMFNGGVVQYDEGVGLYEWTAYNYKLQVKVKRYCRMFKPVSQKNINIMRYIRLVEYPIERVKTNRAWVKVRRLIDTLNKEERKWAVTMVRHPYHTIYKENVNKQIEVARRGGSREETAQIKKEGDEAMPNWEIHRNAPQPTVQI